MIGIKRVEFKGFSIIIPNAYTSKEVVSYSEMRENYFLKAYTRNDRRSILSIVFAVLSTQRLPIELTEMFGRVVDINILEQKKGTMLIKSIQDTKDNVSYSTFIMQPIARNTRGTLHMYILTTLTQTRGWPPLTEVLPVFTSLEIPKIKMR